MTDADRIHWPPGVGLFDPQSWVGKQVKIRLHNTSPEEFVAAYEHNPTRDDAHSVRVENPDMMIYPTTAEWSEQRSALSVDNEEVLRRRIERAKQDIDEYSQKLAWLSSLPEEPTAADSNGDGPVVFFTKKYGRVENRGWDYAAVRVADALSGSGAWYVTGGNKAGLHGIHWRELLAFVFMKETEDTSPVIYRATEWQVL